MAKMHMLFAVGPLLDLKAYVDIVAMHHTMRLPYYVGMHVACPRVAPSQATIAHIVHQLSRTTGLATTTPSNYATVLHSNAEQE